LPPLPFMPQFSEEPAVSIITSVPAFRGTCCLLYYLHVSQVSGEPAIFIIIYVCPNFHWNRLSPLSQVPNFYCNVLFIIFITCSPCFIKRGQTSVAQSCSFTKQGA
jgi:hypothetical protein